MSEGVDVRIVQQENAALRARLGLFQAQTDRDGSPPGGSGGSGMKRGEVRERLAKVEERTSSLAWGLGLVVAIMLAGFAFTGAQLSSLDNKVSALPGAIEGNLRDLTKTLAESITAAKQQSPQVILMQPPAAPAAPAPKAQ